MLSDQRLREIVNGKALGWLLDEDLDNPGARFFALVDLCHEPQTSAKVVRARRAIMRHGPVPKILEAQEAEGYWAKPGPGYNPKYRSSVWSVIMLAQLGADPGNAAVKRAGEYILDHSPAPSGAFSISGTQSGAIYCLNGNLVGALIDLGFLGDPRLERAIEWLGRATTGQGMGSAEEKTISPRYLRSGTCGPTFRCSANNGLPCAWGGLKTMKAFSKIPEASRSRLTEEAIKEGIEFLFSRDPAAADYPMGWSEKPNRSWWRFGYPVFYISDVLQTIEVLCELRCAGDPRLDKAYQLLLEKKDEESRWLMEYSYNGKTWVDIEQKGKPSKWVTLRALRVLKRRLDATSQ